MNDFISDAGELRRDAGERHQRPPQDRPQAQRGRNGQDVAPLLCPPLPGHRKLICIIP